MSASEKSLTIGFHSQGTQVRMSLDGMLGGLFPEVYTDESLTHFSNSIDAAAVEGRGAEVCKILDDFGATLFQNIAQGLPGFIDALRSLPSGATVCLEFDDSAAHLLRLPWDYLLERKSEQDRGQRIAAKYALVRRLGGPKEFSPVSGRPLRLAVAICEPLDVPEFGSSHVYERLLATLKPYVNSGALDLTFLPRPVSRDEFAAALNSREFDVVQFFGHGETEGLLFEGDCGQSDSAASDGIAALLGGKNVGLVVLAACRSAACSELDPLDGTAQSLAHAGVPNVVAMQFMAGVEAALDFIQDMYRSILGERRTGLARAVQAARAARFFARGKNDAYQWGVPVLYLQGSGDLLFEGDGAGKPAKLEQWPEPRPNNVVVEDKPFVGRNEQMIRVNAALRGHNLVVLLGMGGIGKTALAQHIARWQIDHARFPAGVAFVSFESPKSPGAAVDDVGAALCGDEFRRAAGNHLELIKEHFSKSPGLVIFDNYEAVASDTEMTKLVSLLSNICTQIPT